MVRKVTIRLQRNRVYKRPQYRIVVMFKNTKTRGAPLDILGIYNPMSPYKMCFINVERLAYWAHKGAEVSDRVVRLIGLFFSSHFKNKYLTDKLKEKKYIKGRLITEESSVFMKNVNMGVFEVHQKYAKRFWAKSRDFRILSKKKRNNLID